MMNKINITNVDIVKSMNDNQKHTLAIQCQLNNVEPEYVISSVKNITNASINFAIELCNNYFKTPAGKEYLEMRKKIEKIGVLND